MYPQVRLHSPAPTLPFRSCVPKWQYTCACPNHSGLCQYRIRLWTNRGAKALEPVHPPCLPSNPSLGNVVGVLWLGHMFCEIYLFSKLALRTTLCIGGGTGNLATSGSRHGSSWMSCTQAHPQSAVGWSGRSFSVWGRSPGAITVQLAVKASQQSLVKPQVNPQYVIVISCMRQQGVE